MESFVRRLRDEEASTMIESIIVLPVVLVLVFSILLLAFSVHDRSTLEGAARRGALYAAHCICDPNYDSIRTSAQRGQLDLKSETHSFNFSGLGSHISPYRYITGSSSDIGSQVEQEVRSILEKTRIPWRQLDVDAVKYQHENKVFYTKVTVSITGSYPIHELFSGVGLGREFEFSSRATVTVNDPDEFIRNADLALDMIIEIDNRTGQHLQGALEKVSQLGKRLNEWREKLKL